MTKITAGLFLSPFFSIKTSGLENLPIKSAFILLPKHQRWEDIPLLSLATSRSLYYIAKHELFLNPLSRWLLCSLGGIPLNREHPLESRRSMKMMLEFLKNGEGIVIFPEGTYFRNKMGPGYAGLIRMVLSRVTPPFIPVGMTYSKKGLRTAIRISFGMPVHGNSYGNANRLFNHIMKEIALLSGL